MVKPQPQVTITLGRSGQKVVKESRGDSKGGYANDSVAAGSKRMREDLSMRSCGNGRHKDVAESHIGPQDLRLKLLRKRQGLGIKNDMHKKMELHEKVSRALKPWETPHRGFLRNGMPSRVATISPLLDSVNRYSASWNSNAVRSRSAYELPKSTGRLFYHRRSIDELPRPLMRPVDAVRAGNLFRGDPLHSTRSMVPRPTPSRCPLNYDNHDTALAPITGGIFRSSYPEGQPLTVRTLLHSVGLAKYCANFEVEEIDIDALKQMGEGDLKELGIPMGPRKKILLALHARTKRHTIHTRSSYVP